MLVFIILCLLATAVGLILKLTEESEADVYSSAYVYNSDYSHGSFVFFEPDYESDIFKDEEYLKYVPYIYYTRDGVTRCITDENYTPYGSAVEFFGKYFDALKAGDTELFNSMHSERYFENNRRCEAIAPQKLYNINVEYVLEKDINDPDYGDVTLYLFKTSYMILKNDGTFRSDIGSDTSRTLYLELIDDGARIFVDACGDKYELD